MENKLNDEAEQKSFESAETFVSKLQNPQNFYTSFFLMCLRLNRMQKAFQMNKFDTQFFDSILSNFKDDNFRKNKRAFRKAFQNFERKLQTTVFLNEQIIVERKYENQHIQSFFEYVLSSAEITSDRFDVEILFERFTGEYLNAFSSQIKSISQKNVKAGQSVKTIGRPRSSIDKKGNLKNLSKDVKSAIKLYNGGKNGREIINELFPRKKYKKHSYQTKDTNNLKKILRFHWKNNSRLFTRPYDANTFSYKSLN